MVLEICLLVIGIVVIIISFLVTAKEKGAINSESLENFDINEIAGDVIREKVDAEVDNVIDEKVEKFEVQLDKITNEKIMALGEYNDTIKEENDKNHKEVVFLYDMLKTKEEEVRLMMTDIENLKKSIKALMEENNQPSALDLATKNEALKKTSKVNNKQDLDNKKQENIENNKDIEENKGKASKKTSSTKAKDVEKAENNLKDAAEEKNIKEVIQTNETAKEDTSKEFEEDVQPENNNNDKILELYNQGKSNVQIAKELGLGVGEVRLVVDLFKK